MPTFTASHPVKETSPFFSATSRYRVHVSAMGDPEAPTVTITAASEPIAISLGRRIASLLEADSRPAPIVKPDPPANPPSGAQAGG